MVETNRRHSPRQNEDATIQLILSAKHASPGRGQSESMPVKMGNHSQEGLYIETRRALEPGSNVRIKMVSPEGEHLENAYFMRDGQVIWCKRVGARRPPRFGVGIKILRKVVQADVLTSRFR